MTFSPSRHRSDGDNLLNNVPPEEPNTPSRSTVNYSTLKRHHKERIVPQLLESDIEESFVRGAV